MKNPRPLLCRTLAKTGHSGNLQLLLDELLPKVDPRQRGWVRDLLSGCYRRLISIDWLLEQKLAKPLAEADQDIRWLLRLATYQLFWGNTPPHHVVSESVESTRGLRKQRLAGLVNGVLRNLLRDPEALDKAPEHVRLAHPEWLLNRLKSGYPEQWPAIVAANNGRGPMCLRVNLERISRDAYLGLLEQGGLGARRGQITPCSVYLEEACNVDSLPGFDEGLVSVQDEAAQLAAFLLPAVAGERVLDACAAPGGKTLHLLEQGWETVLAVELEPRRAQRIQQNLERCRLHAEVHVQDAGKPEQWWDGRAFHSILLDAPCSASGVIRRHPDIKLQRRVSDLATMARRQRSLLEALWPLLAVDGKLLYVTCSVLEQENDRVLDGFLADHADASAEVLSREDALTRRHGIQFLPCEAAQDGFYYARLTKSVLATE